MLATHDATVNSSSAFDATFAAVNSGPTLPLGHLPVNNALEIRGLCLSSARLMGRQEHKETNTWAIC